MSFALLNRLAYIIGDPERIGLILLDPTIREVVLKELIAKRSKTGRVLEPVEIEDTDISQEHIEALLDWAAEHVMVFTVRLAEKSAAHALRHQEKLLNLTSTAIGLANSVSKRSAA
jgi:hypothetical protein